MSRFFRDYFKDKNFQSYISAKEEENGLNPSDFTMRYSKSSKRTQAHVFGASLVFGILFQVSNLFPFNIAFYASSAIFLFSFLYQVSYQCHITPQKIVQFQFWIFKKEISWNIIIAKKAKKNKEIDLSEYRTPTVILFQSNGKKVFRFVDTMVGFTYLQKMIKQKKIPKARKNIKNSR